MKTSQLAENLKGSEILHIGGIVRAMLAKGEKIYNLTIGDFDTSIFSSPELLKNEVIKAYQEGQTNYPFPNGEISLRKSISAYLTKVNMPAYNEDEILISAGARPLIYAFYKTVVDPGDIVFFPVPSWNNDAYTFLNDAKSINIATLAENKFTPIAGEIAPYIDKISLIALCSPLNPTGTVFSEEQLGEICDMILKENRERLKTDRKPVYLLYDSIYWQLTYGGVKNPHPVLLRPEMKDFTLSIDGVSKAFAATGIRVGWGYGPLKVIQKMTALLTHVGAWAPKPEQLATANFLNQFDETQTYLEHHKEELSERLTAFYHGFQLLKSEGFAVGAIKPEAALYLSVNLELKGKKTKSGIEFKSARDITKWLIEDVRIALVPFYAFGSDEQLNWFRLSVGTVKISDIPQIIDQLREGLKSLQ